MTDRIETGFIGRITFPLSNHFMNRRGIVRAYRELIASQWYPEDRIRALQNRRLRDVIERAARYVPFYQRRFRNIGLEPGDIADIDDLRGIPPLTRQDVIEYHHELVDQRWSDALSVADSSARGPGIPIPFSRFRGRRLIKNTSSGSTGAPTTFYENGSITAHNWAFEQRFKQWYGIPPGTREARMYRFRTDYHPRSSQNLMRRYLWNQLVLPGSNMTDRDYAMSLDRIRRFRPGVIWGFTGALTGLAEHIRDRGINVEPFRPRLLIGWAAPVYEHEERLLRDVFHCAVDNIYGAREVGHIAAQCPEKTFHINHEYLVVEEDTPDDGQDIGEILVTTLVDTPMPFIRYRMGDLGRIVPSTCSCGRTLQVLSNFLGRTGEILKTFDGRMIPPNFWCRTFMAYEMSESVKRFQVIYKSDRHLVVRIVRNQNYTERSEAHLKTFLAKNFDPAMKIAFEYVPEIATQISGKYQMVVNEAAHHQGA